MKIDINAFPKHTYIGRGEEREGFTPGQEYSRIHIGTWFNDNTYGVYMTSDNYEGTDIDYCEFFPMTVFNSKFTPPIPLSQTPVLKDRNRAQYLHRKKKLNIARDKFGKDFVEQSLKEGDAGKIYSMSYKCSCASCRKPHSPKVESKLLEMDNKLKEFEEGLEENLG